MASLNHCQFIGNLGQDPDVKYMPSGAAIASISVACTESWKDKESGQKKERTEWVRVTAFGKLAEIMSEYLKKGSQVYISGRMQTDEYEKDGVKKYSTKIVADKMIMLGGKSGSASPGKQKDEPAESGGGFVDDDIPFMSHEYRTVA